MGTPDAQIVITGAGLSAALGLDRRTIWSQIISGRSGIRPLTAIEQPLFPNKGGGEAPALPSGGEHCVDEDVPREARYLRHTIRAALSDAGLELERLPYDRRRCGVILGTTLHGMRAAGRFLRSNDPDDLRPFLATATIDLAAGDLGLTGSTLTTCSACSSGLASIGLAITLLACRQLDLVVAGGYDPISEYAYAGFNSLRLIADGATQPFCRGRQGLNIGEGFGVVILERRDDAEARQAPRFAQLLGYAESADAHHLTQPAPSGEGAARAMTEALADAGLTADDIDMIAAHATGTPDNDVSEFAALQAVFGDRMSDVPVVTFKSYLGHTLGGAGAVELVLSGMARQAGLVPRAINVAPEQVEFSGLRLPIHGAEQRALRYTLNTSLGFGGANACTILGPVEEPSPDKKVKVTRPVESRHDVWITGIGVLLPGATGVDAFAAAVARRDRLFDGAQDVPFDETAIASLLNTRRVRRMSPYVKLALAATTLACRDAAVDDDALFFSTCPAILGTTHGSAGYSGDYYRQIVEQGIDAANPMLFAEGVPNAGAAHLSLMLGAKGGCQTFLGSRTSGLDALRLATLRIAHGQWDRAVVNAGEELAPLVQQAYQACGLRATEGHCNGPFAGSDGFIDGWGAVTFILERADVATQRGVDPWAAVTHTAGGSFAPRDLRAAVDTVTHVHTSLDAPQHLITCANATWLDRVDEAALRGVSNGPLTITTPYGHMPETFSVMPLAGLAAALANRRLPRLLGGGLVSERTSRPADGDREIDDVGVLCSDYHGTTCGVRVSFGSRTQVRVA